MEDWGAVRDRLAVDAEEMVKEFRSAGSKRQGADIRAALGEIKRLKQRDNYEERISNLLRDVEILSKRAEAAEAAHKEAAAQWQDESRLRRAANAANAILDKEATGLRQQLEAAEAKLAEAEAEFLGWNEAQASGRELELEAKLADALVKADCGATTPEPCRLSPPCLTCYTVAKEAEVERLTAALDEWRKHDSAPDCVACAVLDAAACGALRVEDLLDGLPRLSTEDEVRGIVDGKLVKMREIKR